MKVFLAGYNVDRDVLEELKRHAPPRQDATPETLSAAYARISRDARPVDELRRAARAEVEQARRSNAAIIFGMGHHSVAEHAVFNFDIIGVSRLAVEEIERFRLGSYTEKSQRYISLGDDFVVPEEVGPAGAGRDLFLETVRAQNALYRSLLERLRPYVSTRYPALAANPKKRSLLDGWAKEDARYAVSLAAESQLGLTMNARNLELLVRRFGAKPLAELRDLRRRIFAAASDVAPSLLRFTEAGEFETKTYGDLAETRGRGAGARPAARRRASGEARLVAATPGGDDRILAALLHTVSGRPYGDGLSTLRTMAVREKRDFARRTLARMEFHDFPLREFEFADLTFELVLSASCFAQLKRHRLATLTYPGYDPALGVTVPPSIEALGARAEFMAMIGRTNAAHAVLKKRIGPAADYVLTNAHRRRALLKVNLRELYHISRLREDASAQWDIRALAGKMTRLAQKAFPLTGVLLGGKDAYPGIYERRFGRKPAAVPPDILR